MKKQLGHYEIIAELGRGGMGVVYKGFEPSLNRYVAIKVLADALAHDASVKERFLREARSMAALNDSHIIQIYYIGEDSGQPYFVMEFVEGESLASLLKREGKLTPEQAAKVIHQTAQGLGSAHDKGVIHRDIKPANLMVTSKGGIKIADFGIALVSHDFSKKLTSTGEFVGTPGYLSPEICLGKPVDQRSDIFSLGVVLFECLTGRMPFTDESPLGLMLEVVRAEVPDVRQLNDQIDSELAGILTKMIAKEPTDRYQSCQDLATDLGCHPLVAKGGAITLQPAISAAAATVMGMKTPTSDLSPAAMPPALNASTKVSSAGEKQPQAAPAPVRQPVLSRPAPRSAPSVLPWAIAATLLLGVVGGTTYAFRNQIPYFQSASTSVPGITESSPAPAASMQVTPPPSVVSTPPSVAATSTAIETKPISEGTESVNSIPSSTDAIVQMDTPSVPSMAPTASSSAQGQAEVVSSAAIDGPAARASRVEPLKDLPAARAAESIPKVIAKSVEPTPKVAAPKPRVPTIALIAVGDSAIAEPAEQVIEETLARTGFNLVDQSVIPRVNRMLRGDHPDFGSVLQTLARSGKADVVVFIHARPVGTQDLTYYGRSSTLYTAQIEIKAYHVSDQHMLGPGWNEQVSFTTLNASEKAREAIEPLMGEVTDKLADYRVRKGRSSEPNFTQG